MTAHRRMPDSGHVLRGRERDERVQTIVDLIIGEKWRAGSTERELAQRWDVDESTVRHYKADALRVLRAITSMDTESVRVMIARRCDDLYALATERESPVVIPGGRDGPATYDMVRDPDIKGAVAALKLYGDVAGAIVRRHEVTVAEKVRAELEAKSEDELLEEARQLSAELEKRDGNGKAGAVH